MKIALTVVLLVASAFCAADDIDNMSIDDLRTLAKQQQKQIDSLQTALRSRAHLRIEQPQMLGSKPVIQADIVEVVTAKPLKARAAKESLTWTICVRFKNLAPYEFRQISARARLGESFARGEWAQSNFDTNAVDLWVFTVTSESGHEKPTELVIVVRTAKTD